MAKVSIKSEKITAFGGIFFVLDKFDRILSSVIDSHLGLRSKLIGYQYSEIIRAIFSVFCCGGDCMEDLNLYLKDVLTERPHTRVPSADTVLRGIEELATENISYTSEKTGNVYDFNTAEKLNQLLIKLLLATGQLAEGGEYDVDFDHQFLEAEKYDCKRTYKGFDGYSPGVFTIGGLIIYLENRDGNANVRFMQADTHRHFFEMMRSFGIHVRSFRADCGSYSEDIVKMVMEHTDKFYIRAERYAGLYEKVKRQRKQKGEQLDLFDGEYTYRCILTNDWDMTEEEIIQHYNKRGTAEQVFDRQNNDFGWAHLPKSFMNQNTVFLLLTAMAANFYQYIVSLPLMCLSGWKQRTGSRASCSDSLPCRPSGLGQQGKMYSTFTQVSHTTSSGLTDRKNTFVGHSSRQSDFGERGDCASKCDILQNIITYCSYVGNPLGSCPNIMHKKTSADFGTTISFGIHRYAKCSSLRNKNGLRIRNLTSSPFLPNLHNPAFLLWQASPSSPSDSRPLSRGSKSPYCLYYRPNSCFGKRFLETISVNLLKSLRFYNLFS